MSTSSVRDLIHSGKAGTKVLLRGWVRTRRDSKGCSFIEVNDGSSLASLQVVAETDRFPDDVSRATTGASVEIEGELVDSPGKGQRVELRAEKISVIGGCPPDGYPLQKKRHSLEFLRSIAHLRPRTNTLGAAFRIRSRAAFAIHRFFQERAFLYVHTPIITTSDCEGAGKMFRVTTLDLEKVPCSEAGGIDFREDFFGTEASLTVSGQLEAEAFACSLGNVYTFGPTFRAENSNTPRHLAEFWMVEPEMAFCDLTRCLEVAEEFVRFVIDDVLTECQEDLAFCDQWIEKGIVGALRSVADATFERLTYDEAIVALERSGRTFEYPVQWGVDLQTEHERFLTEDYVGRPVFITHYPRQLKPFYMRLDGDERTVAATDLLVPRLGELIGGSQREERENVLRERIQEFHLPEESYWWYLELRRFGTVPHSGFGLGFERLIMYLTGISNIRDVIPFPRTPGSAAF